MFVIISLIIPDGFINENEPILDQYFDPIDILILCLCSSSGKGVAGLSWFCWTIREELRFAVFMLNIIYLVDLVGQPYSKKRVIRKFFF